MIKLFSGTSNQPLAEKVARKLKTPLGKMEIARFKNSECRVRVLEDVRNQACLVFQSTSAPTDEHLMEMFLMVDSLKRSAASRVIAVLPYFGYARQNQQHRIGECVSAHVVSKFIEIVGVDELITLDLHEEQISGFFNIPMTHLSAVFPLTQAVKLHILRMRPSIKNVQVSVISPDQGGIERARRFLGKIHNNLTSDRWSFINVDEDVVVVEKKRDLEKMHVSRAIQVVGDVKNKVAIIVDDIITSGGTIINAAEALVEAGTQKIFVAATHADFIEGAVEKLQNSPVEKVFVTDTISLSPEKIFPKLEVISVAGVLAEVISKLGNS